MKIVVISENGVKQEIWKGDNFSQSTVDERLIRNQQKSRLDPKWSE